MKKALRQLRKPGATINVAVVAAKAGVSRNTIYKHRDLLATIDQYRQHPVISDPDTPAGRESTIVSALRRKLAERDSNIRELKKQLADQQNTIELLYGRIDELSR